MISLADTAALQKKLYAVCADSPFGCQIASLADAYGFDRAFVLFWTDGSAAYSLMDGVMRIAGEISNTVEMCAFLRATGAKTVFCSLENAEKLTLKCMSRGAVLQKDLPAGTPRAEKPVSLRDVFELLQANQMLEVFEPFYLDLSHRLRHGAASCTADFCGDEIISCAAAVKSGYTALITAVAVRPDLHRKGYGRKILRDMEALLASHKVFVLRGEKENELFYAACGYQCVGKWCCGTL